MPEIRDRIRELRRVPASSLIPNAKNWRTHPRAQSAALRDLLQEIGYANALIARELEDGSLVLIDGHLRAETTPDMVVPVLILDVTEEEADKLLLTLDPLGAMAEASRDNLASLLDSVANESAAVQALLDDLARREHIVLPAREGLTDPDEAPPLAPEPVSKCGDLFLLGNHRFLCGDSTRPEDVARLVGEERAACIWTDAPYGVEYVGGTKDALTIENDQAEGLLGLLINSFRLAGTYLEPGSPFYVCHPAGPLAAIFWKALEAVRWQIHEDLVWVKDSMVLGHADYHYRHEPILYGWTPGPGRSGRGRHQGSRWYGDHSQTTVFEVPRPKASPDHPTQKPIALIEQHLRNSTAAGGTVLDPFLGSGSTLIACERLGRRCLGLDIDPRYCDVAIARWERYTGRKATLQA